MHAGVRADRRKDGFAVTLPPGTNRAGGVSATRQATGRGNHPATNPSCWHQAGARGCRGGGSKSAVATKSIALSIDGGHVRAARQYQGRTFEVLLAQVSNDAGTQVVFASVPAEATSQTRQLRGVLHGLGGATKTELTTLS